MNDNEQENEQDSGPTEFEMALIAVAGFCLRCMNQEAVDDILIVAFAPEGAMQFIGTGKVHPTNEEIRISGGAILIFRSDLQEAVKQLTANSEPQDESGESGNESEGE